MTFADRFGRGSEWEEKLDGLLVERGWMVAPFGQAQIPKDFRRVLQQYADTYGRPTLIRWLPDRIALHPDREPHICLVDAKADSGQTNNYAVEISALEADKAIVDHLRTPVFYVWPDGGVMTPHAVEQRHHTRRDGKGANGSGTPFYLVDKCWRQAFKDVFGPPIDRTGAA